MAKLNVDDIVKAIAADTNTPAEAVAKMYADTWAEYSAGAKITDYMPVLVAKCVRDALRRAARDPAH